MDNIETFGLARLKLVQTEVLLNPTLVSRFPLLVLLKQNWAAKRNNERGEMLSKFRLSLITLVPESVSFFCSSNRIEPQSANYFSRPLRSSILFEEKEKRSPGSGPIGCLNHVWTSFALSRVLSNTILCAFVPHIGRCYFLLVLEIIMIFKPFNWD